VFSTIENPAPAEACLAKAGFASGTAGETADCVANATATERDNFVMGNVGNFKTNS
jgi:hypothetical protein